MAHISNTRNLTGAEFQDAVENFAKVLGIEPSAEAFCDATPTYFSETEEHPHFVHRHFARDGEVSMSGEVGSLTSEVPDKVVALWVKDTNTLSVTVDSLAELDRTWKRRLQDQAVMIAPLDFGWVMSFHGEDYASVNKAFSQDLQE